MAPRRNVLLIDSSGAMAFGSPAAIPTSDAILIRTTRRRNGVRTAPGEEQTATDSKTETSDDAPPTPGDTA